MRYYVILPGGHEVAIDLVQHPGGRIDVSLDGEHVDVDAIDADGAVSVRIGTRIFDLWLESDADSVGFVGAGQRARARIESDRTRIGAKLPRAGALGGAQVVAPMPGRVVKVLVTPGEVVPAGRPLVVVEAMKMENELSSDRPGVVTNIRVAAGQNVDSGALLVELAPAEV
jgi:biotin carboxyl carrier protein